MNMGKNYQNYVFWRDYPDTHVLGELRTIVFKGGEWAPDLGNQVYP